VFGLGGFLGDLTNVVGDVFTGGAVSNTQAVKDTNLTQMELAEKQMGFQREMSNTAYQRAMTDIRAAGINPLLMTPGGASTPSGAMASLTAPEPGKIGAGLASSAKDAIVLNADVQNKNSSTELNKETANKAAAETRESNQRRANIFTDTQLKYSQTKKASEDARAAKANADMAERENSLSRQRYAIDKKLMVPDAVIDRINTVVRGSSSRSPGRR